MKKQKQQKGSQRVGDYPRVSVVIPAQNEAKNLPYVLPRIPSFVTEVILVDGHSSDETIMTAKELLPAIRIIKQRGTGKGNALQLGFAACSGDIIVMLDADGSANPDEIPQFIEALLGGNDFAKGSRFVENAGSYDFTWLRRLGCLGLSTLVNLLFRTKFSDLCYGYNAFWRSCLAELEIDCEGFEVEALINIRMHKLKLRIVEVPSIEYSRLYGESHLYTFRDGWRVFKTIVREWGRTLTQPKLQTISGKWQGSNRGNPA
jgi:glycosyltransferase involved in cell wall biosynthesis